MPDIKKYKSTEIIICNVTDQQIPPSDLAALLSELNVYEKEVNLLMSDLSKVDKSISAFRDSCNAAVEKVERLSTTALDLFMKGDSSKEKGLIAFGALALKGVEYGREKLKQQEALQEYNDKMDAILQYKVDMAETKLPHISESYRKFNSGIKAQMEKLYDKEFDVITTYGDELLEKRALIFKKNLCMIIKARFLGDTMHYCIEEMKSWKKGKHSSKETYPSIENELSQELASWPEKLGFGNLSFNDMISQAMCCSSRNIPVPVATILVDPCLLRNYVGIKIGEAENCSCALISLNSLQDRGLNNLVRNNLYYLHCENILKNEYRPPKHAIGFSLWDLIKLLLLPAALFGVLLLMFHWEHSTLWRIFFMIPIFCWVGLGIEAIEENFDDYFPYVSRLQKYNESFGQFRKQIIEKENCKEFHILG